MASNIPNDKLFLPPSWRGMASVLMIAGLICIMLSAAICYLAGSSEVDGWTIFCHSYLANYVFCLTICLGALFFVMVTHLVRASWCASFRRIAELFAFTIPLWAILFIPILLTAYTKNDWLYPWALGPDSDLPGIVKNKLDYLNPLWFTIRVAIYFAVWIFAARFYFTMSRKQDETGDSEITLKLQKWAGPMIMLFALSVNFGAFDIVMSTDPAWFSTIYGVYIFAASMLSFFATTILSCYLLQRNGRIEKFVNTEHFQDMSKFQFGFIVFWSYIAFSQFLLYWYGNLPEETTWYMHRGEHGWLELGFVLIALHFVVPFLGTMSRHIRRRKAIMAGWACFILFVHALDMLFLVMPYEGIHLSFSLLLGHFVCWAGMFCLFVSIVLMRVGDTPLVAVKDPWLSESLAYEVGP
ncbi:MAG: hypothetical protein AAF483_00715 [Planctomycetota bacterium]